MTKLSIRRKIRRGAVRELVPPIEYLGGSGIELQVERLGEGSGTLKITDAGIRWIPRRGTQQPTAPPKVAWERLTGQFASPIQKCPNGHVRSVASWHCPDCGELYR